MMIFVLIYAFHHHHRLAADNTRSRCAARRLFFQTVKCVPHLPSLEEGSTRLHEATNVI